MRLFLTFLKQQHAPWSNGIYRSIGEKDLGQHSRTKEVCRQCEEEAKPPTRGSYSLVIPATWEAETNLGKSVRHCLKTVWGVVASTEPLTSIPSTPQKRRKKKEQNKVWYTLAIPAFWETWLGGRIQVQPGQLEKLSKTPSQNRKWFFKKVGLGMWYEDVAQCQYHKEKAGGAGEEFNS